MEQPRHDVTTHEPPGGEAPSPAPPWHTLWPADVLARLETTERGLASEEAARRLEVWGPNELPSAERVSPWKILAEQFKNVLIVILLLGAGLSAGLGHEIEAIAITVIVLFAVVLGFVQEYRAERAIEVLRKMAAPTATALRDGDERELPAADLVPGDVVLLQMGDRVPADGRVIEAFNLRLNESSLTGESAPVAKHVEALSDPELVVGDRTNSVCSGTEVVYGRGKAVVVATGLQTEFGKITRLLQPIPERRTPLQENLDRVGRVLAVAALVLVALIAGLGVLRGAALLDMFIFAVALAVAVVPEALPAVVTISLAIGLQRMARRNALVRHLPTVETLGSTSVICSDKTGTLTRDEMTVRRLYVAGRNVGVTGSGYAPEGEFVERGQAVEVDDLLRELLMVATLASEARLVRSDGQWTVRGDPTEGAVVVAAAKAGLERAELERARPRIDEVPFTSERKRMTTLHRSGQGTLACAKGAPELLLESCTRVRGPEGEAILDETTRAAIRDAARSMGDDALRVLGVACKADTAIADAERDMTFLGLIGMIDPPRVEAMFALKTCETAGVHSVMITGDHPATATAVARELGILHGGRVMTGAELNAVDDEALEQMVDEVEVYARVSPEHKLRVVDAWQRRGHVVAMTGDGVNDAPALKRADVGVAMGITGTDVSREAADMTLLDDNFVSIVGAVEEGRGIFSNIKKYLMYLLSSNIGEIGLMAVATLAGLPLPLTAVQILYVNLATDGLPALALAVDPPEDDLMERPPRDPRVGIFTRPVVVLMLVGGIWSTLANVSLFVWALGSGRSATEAMTMTFVSLVLIQFFKAYNFRSDRHSVFRAPFANKWLNLAILWELMLLALIVYVPFLHVPFSTFALTLTDWAIVGGLALSVVPVLEVTKVMVRRGWLGKLP